MRFLDGSQSIHADSGKTLVSEKKVRVARLDYAVFAGTAVEHIGAVAPGQRVVAGATEQRIVAVAAVQRGAARKPGCIEYVVARTAGQTGLFDGGQLILVGAQQTGIGQCEIHIARLDDSVGVRAAVERVITGVARERVVAGATQKAVTA